MDKTYNRFDNVVVPKPWGYEYEIFQNENVSVWHLHINAGESTSLHAHPNKKTGLLILSGCAKFHFLSSTIDLNAINKVMIHKGVFHRTEAITDVEILEIETSKDKTDIIRLEDNYGRQGKGYESANTYIVDQKRQLLQGINNIGNVNIDYNILDSNMLDYKKYKYIVLLHGGINYQGYYISSPGDIISSKTLQQLVYKFGIDNKLEILGVPNG